MRAKVQRIWLMAACGGILALGCEKAAVNPDLPPDPILVNKRPVQGKVESAPSYMVVRSEPTSPVLPESALVHAPSGLSAVARTITAKPPGPVPQPGPSLDPLPQAPRPATLPPTVSTPTPAPAVPVKNRPVSGNFGHATDHAWLQGVVDKHYSGHVHLRFCDAAVEDEWGGKVCLTEDTRLQALKSGEVVFVEGELLKAGAEARPGHVDRYPLYRIRNVERVPANAGGTSPPAR